MMDCIYLDTDVILDLITDRISFSDFEDALQNYSAEGCHGIKFILTRNIKDYKHSKLVVMTPEMYFEIYCYQLKFLFFSYFCYYPITLKYL